MGNVIALELNVKTCLGFADRLIKEEKYLDAIINLNDAYKYAQTKEEKRDIYVRYLYLLTQTDNFSSAYTILCKLIYTYCTKDYYMFDGVDMVLRDSLLFGNPNAFFGFDGLDIKSREDFIMIRELVKNEDYYALFDILPIIAKPDNPYFNDMLRLVYESTKSRGFNVSSDVVLKSVMQLYPKAPENSYVMSLLLEAADDDVIKVLEKGYRLQLEKAGDDYYEILRIGRAYMFNTSFEVASKFFNKILLQNPYDEETLWTTAQNCFLKDDLQKGRKLLNTYASFFQCSDAPILIYRRYFDSEELEPTRYPFVSEKFINKEIKRLKALYNMFAPSEITVCELEDLYKVIGDRYDELYSLTSKYRGEVMQGAILRLLSSMRVNSYHKVFLFGELVESDYEGGFDMVYKDRIYCANILKLKARGIGEEYFQYYKEIASMIPFCEEMIPLKCSILAEITKKVAKELAEEDKLIEGVAKFVIFNRYVKKLRVKIDKRYYLHVFNKSNNKNFTKMCNNLSN